MKQLKYRPGGRTAAYLFTFVILVYVIVFMNTPYIVYQPGSAAVVSPMIKVENADQEEKGVFMMTTVSASYANVALLVMSAFNDNAEVDRKEARLGNHTEAEYAAEQIYYMNSSQSSAIQAAYRQAGIPYDNVTEYLYVFSVPESGSGGSFVAGDRIQSVAGKPVTDPEALSKLLSSRSVGDTVKVKLLRGGKELTEAVKLVAIKDEGTEKTRPGLGVIIAAVQKVQPREKGHEVSFSATDVGGPSAGLMFSLEILNRLTPGDLTRGYRVAGTGTIDEEGKVGPIGGVKHKIVAAHREKADFFFVPVKNYLEAETKANSLRTGMKLVPVENMQDALNYLEKLPVKP